MPMKIEATESTTSPPQPPKPIMSDDDDVDVELQDLLRQHLGLNPQPTISAQSLVLPNAKFVCDNAIDVAISSSGTKAAAAIIHSLMQAKKFDFKAWSEHELHPKSEDGERAVEFVFVMDLLNFCFWSGNDSEKFAVEWKGRTWTGYWSLVAALRRALDEGMSYEPLIAECKGLTGFPLCPYLV